MSDIIYNTNLELKRKYFDSFVELIRNQFEHGGDKYKVEGMPEIEHTDFICAMSPGKTGIDWILQTITKYCGRYLNFQREKDILKIATFAYISWLKKGYYLQQSHDEDVKIRGD